MKWLTRSVVTVALLPVSLAMAQSDRLRSVSKAYSACLKHAAEAEKIRAKPDINRIKNACKDEYRALAKMIPAKEEDQIMTMIEQGLKKELRH